MKIRNKYIVIVFVFMLNININSQNSFDLLIKTNLDETVYNAIESNSGNFVLVGVRNNEMYYSEQNALIIIVDNEGEVIQEKEFIIEDSLIYFSSIYQKNNNNYLCFGRIRDIANTYSAIYTCELDESLNIVKSKTFSSGLISNKQLNISGLIINRMNNIVLYGSTVSYSKTKQIDIEYLFFEISQNLDSINMAIQDDPINNNFNQINSLIENQNSGYYAIVRSKALKFDNNFNLITEVDTPPFIQPYSTLKWFSDSSFIFSSNKVVNTDKFQNNEIFCLISDTLFSDIYNQQYFGTPDTADIPGQLSSIDFIDNNNIFIVGVHDFRFGNPTAPDSYNYILVSNTNSLLEKRYEYFYGGWAGFYVWSVTATSDGGCIICSSSFDHKTQSNERDALILKIDSEGNLPVSTEEPKVKTQELIIYPNPSKTILNIFTAVQHIGGQLTIYNISGKQILKQKITQSITQINTEYLPNGTYIYNYVHKGNEIESGKWIKNAL